MFGSRGSVHSLSYSSTPTGQVDTSLLEDQCHYFLAQGLAPSTRKSYASGQRKFYDFCLQAEKLHHNGSPCPVEEWTLCLFVSFLADSIQHASVYQAYLSAVCSLHIKQEFPDPLLNCLCLCVLRGVKRSQGSPVAPRLPVTDTILDVIRQAPYLHF